MHCLAPSLWYFVMAAWADWGAACYIVLLESMTHGYQCQGGLQLHGGDQGSSQCQPYVIGPKHCCLLYLVIRVIKEHNAVKHWMQQALLTWRRDRLRSGVVVGFGPLRLVAKARQSAYTYLLLPNLVWSLKYWKLRAYLRLPFPVESHCVHGNIKASEKFCSGEINTVLPRCTCPQNPFSKHFCVLVLCRNYFGKNWIRS